MSETSLRSLQLSQNSGSHRWLEPMWAHFWSSMRDLASWSENDHENKGRCLKTTRDKFINELKAIRNQFVTHWAIMDWHFCCARKVPLLKNAPVKACVKFASLHLHEGLGVLSCGLMKPKLSCLLVCRMKKKTSVSDKHHPLGQVQRWKHYVLGLFCCRGYRANSPKWGGQWMEPWTVKSWTKTWFLSKNTEDGLWMSLPAWKWPKTYHQGGKGVALEEVY